MRSARLVRRGLAYHWRGHAAVVLGVACAVSALAGSLLVGDSVRASLREIFLRRLGRADHALTSARFFREALAAELTGGPQRAAAPLIVLDGVVTHEPSGRRAGRVAVYGVDTRFWEFHGLPDPQLGARDALASAPLAAELSAAPGDALVLRVARPSDVPGATLFGRRDDLGRTLRLALARVQPSDALGEFSLRAQQQPVPALFVPLTLLQRTLEREAQVNVVLLAEAVPPARFRTAVRLEDLGLRVRSLASRHALSIESETGLLGDETASAARSAAGRLGFRSAAYLTYLANAIRTRARSIPYSLVTAREPEAADASSAGEPRRAGAAPPIWLNDWAAGELGAVPGEAIFLDYYAWLEAGRLETRTAEFALAGRVPLGDGDADLTPSYPGISDSLHLSEWEPPFPVSLAAIRPRDEEYWDRYRTTPKAFVELREGQVLWRHRLGGLTSLRLLPPPSLPLEAAEGQLRTELARELDPLALGLRLEPVRESGLEASAGVTDFGEYFAYFSAFLVASALLLAGLFFRLGVEQRRVELGLLRAVGFPARRVQRLFVAEGLTLAALGSLLGLVGATAAAHLMMIGLRTLWSGATGTHELRLHVGAPALVQGGLGGVAIAALTIVLTLRGLRRVSPRALLAGSLEEPGRRAGAGSRARSGALAALAAAAALVAASLAGALSATVAFFGAGTLLLAAALLRQWGWLLARPRGGTRALLQLGFRNAAHRPGRSLLCIALVAFATFVIVATGAFRREAADASAERDSGTGGYALLAESLLPIHHDPASPEGREALGLGDVAPGARFDRFRLRPGDDASCLNLYRPRNPRVLGATPEFIREARFGFQASLAETPEEKANPWLLLERPAAGDAIPAIADANSLAYVLHAKLGDELVLEREGSPVRLRFVAALRDSLFQGEVLIAERRFLEAFPEIEGYRLWLVDAPGGRAQELAGALEARLSDVGLDATDVAARLAGFHRVENTYLATFQTLGALGLLLGTVGLATVLLRNALERRRELALLRAVGFRPDHLTRLLTSENALLLVLGLLTGAACALLAVAPALATRGGRFPWPSLLGLLALVLLAGLAVTRLAAAWVRRSPLVKALRSE
jgi:hypothetical protein